MGDVRALRGSDVTPTIVLDAIAKDIGELTELYVIGIDKEGHDHIWVAGDLQRLALIGLLFQDLALKYLNGQFADETS